MGKFKALALWKKIGIGFAGLFLLAGITGGSNKSQTKIPDVSNNQSQASTIDVSKQPQLDTIESKNESKTEVVAFEATTKNDGTLASGTTKLSVAGVNGERTITYKVTYKNGTETGREQLSDVVTKQPVNQVTLIGTKKMATASSSNCDPNYSGCVPIASDVDCAGGSGNGPAYVSGPINVIGTDIYKLDADHNGIACEN